jgi:AraC-like DNA-binding protein
MISDERELTPDRILQYIEAHFEEPIAPHDVAAALHYSLCHVAHVARRTLGVPVKDLIMRRRMEAARRLLEESDMPISHIAAQVGFADLAYFSRRFAQATGAPPTRWRKLHRQPTAYGRCRTCGNVVPLVSLAQDNGAQVRATAS